MIYLQRWSSRLEHLLTSIDSENQRWDHDIDSDDDRWKHEHNLSWASNFWSINWQSSLNYHEKTTTFLGYYYVLHIQKEPI